jgi:hypothetical protein
MTPLPYLEDIKEIDWNKSYLLIHVDEHQTSTPFIGTGGYIVKHLLEKLIEQSGFAISEAIKVTGFNIEDFSKDEFIKLTTKLEEYFDSLDSELNELGYSVYMLD